MAFLEPEYEFLRSKKIEDYVSGDLLELYNKVQEELLSYLQTTEEKGFESGFGLADVKLDNLVEDEKGNIFFIDVAKPEKVHWITMMGQIYQDALSNKPDSILVKEIQKKCEELDKDHIVVGRMVRLLLPCTLRNISYNAEIKNPIDFGLVRNNLMEVRALLGS